MCAPEVEDVQLCWLTLQWLVVLILLVLLILPVLLTLSWVIILQRLLLSLGLWRAVPGVPGSGDVPTLHENWLR